MAARLLIIASVLLLSTQVSTATLLSIYARQNSSDAPTCSGKTQGSTFKYMSSDTSYDVLCGQDYYGNDLRAIRVDTFGACLTGCSGDPACVAIAFRDGACYLKSSVAPALSDSNVWSAKKSDAKSLSCDGKASDGLTYSASKDQFKIICGKEYYGGDLSATRVPSFTACIEACATNSECINVL